MKCTILVLLVILTFGCSDKKQSSNDFETRGKIEVNGTQFNYVRQGSGDTTVVIGSSAYYPRAFSDSLKKTCNIYFIDSRHFVPTYNPSDDELAKLSLSTWADDLEAARTKLNLGKLTLIGHSIHGQIALEYASKYPENVKQLVLLCSDIYSPEPKEKLKEYWEKEADENRKAVFKLNMSKKDSILQKTPDNRKFIVSYLLRAPKVWADPNFDATYLWEGVDMSIKAFYRLGELELSREEMVEKLKNLKMPTLVITGKFDFGAIHTEWEQLIQDTKIDYQFMANAGHNPYTEKITQQEFDDILTTWIHKTSKD